MGSRFANLSGSAGSSNRPSRRSSARNAGKFWAGTWAAITPSDEGVCSGSTDETDPLACSTSALIRVSVAAMPIGGADSAFSASRMGTGAACRAEPGSRAWGAVVVDDAPANGCSRRTSCGAAGRSADGRRRSISSTGVEADAEGAAEGVAESGL